MHMWATEVKTKPKKQGPKHPKGGYETSILKPGVFFALPEEEQSDDRVT